MDIDPPRPTLLQCLSTPPSRVIQMWLVKGHRFSRNAFSQTTFQCDLFSGPNIFICFVVHLFIHLFSKYLSRSFLSRCSFLQGSNGMNLTQSESIQSEQISGIQFIDNAVQPSPPSISKTFHYPQIKILPLVTTNLLSVSIGISILDISYK